MISISLHPSWKETIWLSVKDILTNRLLWFFTLLFFLVTTGEVLIEFYHASSLTEIPLAFVLVTEIFVGLYYTLPAFLIMVAMSLVVILGRLFVDRQWVTMPVTYTFTDSAFTAKTDVTESKYLWSVVKRVKQDKNYFYFYLKKWGRKLFFIPKKAFAEADLKKFLAILKAKGLVN